MGLDKLIKIRVVGRNVNKYIKTMIKRKINFIRVDYIDKNEVEIILRYDDYLDLIKYRSILYKVEVIERLGSLKIKDKLKTNRVLILFMVLGLVLLYSLSNVIFNVEVIHQDKNIRNLVKEELRKEGIVKYSFKKNYNELEEIEDRILNKNKDKLEWLEIVIEGTLLKVRIEERLINDDSDLYRYQSIVSKKNAVVRKVDAVRGEVVKEEGSYVKKGDTVISGYVRHPDNSSDLAMALGEVYGEVWYEVEIFYPFVYQESNLTGRNKSGVLFKFFNKELGLFGGDNYRTFSRNNKILYKDNFLDLEVIWEKRYELENKDEVYTEELVQSKAVSYIKEKMMKNNPDIKEVEKVNVLSKEIDYDGIRFDFFVTTIESIGEVVEIEEEQVEE